MWRYLGNEEEEEERDDGGVGGTGALAGMGGEGELLHEEEACMPLGPRSSGEMIVQPAKNTHSA